MKMKIKKFAVALLSACAMGACFMCGCVAKADTSYDWIISTIVQNYYYDIPLAELHEGIMQGGVSSVLDIYSDYYTKEEYAKVLASNSGNKDGIGVSYSFIPEGVTQMGSGVYVSSVVGGSPAYESGLRKGTFVEAVQAGEERVELHSSEDFSGFVSSMPFGEDFTLITDRGDFVMHTANYTASYCTLSTSQKTYSFAYSKGVRRTVEEDEGLSCLPEGAAYLRLDQFYGNAVSEFAELIRIYNDVEKCTSLILDLRGNGGGYVDVMCGISGIFAGQLNKTGSCAMTARYKNGSSTIFPISPADATRTFPAGGKMSVLADNGTASASEALIGVLISLGVIDYGDVYISDFPDNYLEFSHTQLKDCRTYGKGIMQSSFSNRDTGEVLKLTTAKIYWPNGTCIHDVGLTAENCPTVAADWNVTYSDEQLSRAVAVIYAR